MSSFTDKLLVSPLPGGKIWKLEASFSYHVGSKESDEVIVVPKGFTTDFASIPQIFWSMIGSPIGRYTKAAVVHDYLYHSQIYSRRKSDRIFLEAMTVLEVNWLKRRVMYRAVRMFAGGIWSRRKAS